MCPLSGESGAAEPAWDSRSGTERARFSHSLFSPCPGTQSVKGPSAVYRAEVPGIESRGIKVSGRLFAPRQTTGALPSASECSVSNPSWGFILCRRLSSIGHSQFASHVCCGSVVIPFGTGATNTNVFRAPRHLCWRISRAPGREEVNGTPSEVVHELRGKRVVVQYARKPLMDTTEQLPRATVTRSNLNRWITNIIAQREAAKLA